MINKTRLLIIILLLFIPCSSVRAIDCNSDINSDNLISCKGIAINLFQSDQLEKSMEIWSKVKSFADIISDNYSKAESLKYLGNIEIKKQNYIQAENNYNAALDIIEKELENNPDFYILAADSYYNLARVQLLKRAYISSNPDQLLQYMNSIIDLISLAQNIYIARKDVIGEIDCLNLEAKMYYDLMLYQKAEDNYNKVLNILQKNIDNIDENLYWKRLLGTKYNIAEIKYDKNMLKDAFKDLNEVLITLKEIMSEDNRNQFNELNKLVLNKLARTYFEMKEFNKAKECFNQSNAFSVLENDHIRIDNNLGLAEIAMLNNDFVTAENLLTTSAEKFQIVELGKDSNKILSVIKATEANLKYHNKQYKDSIDLYDKALEAQVEFHLYKDISITLNNMANALYYHDLPAGQKLLKVKDILQKSAEISIYDTSTNKIKSLNAELEQLSSELSTNTDDQTIVIDKLYQAALKIIQETSESESNNKLIVLTILMNLGELFYSNNNYEQASKTFEKAKNYALLLNDNYNLWKINYKLSKIAKARDSNEKQIVYLEEALKNIKILQDASISPVIASIESMNSTRSLTPDQYLLVDFYNDYSAAVLSEESEQEDLSLKVINNLTEANLYSMQTTFFEMLSKYNNTEIDSLIENWQNNQKELISMLKDNKKAPEVIEQKNKSVKVLLDIANAVSSDPKYTNIKSLLKIKPDEIVTISKVLPTGCVLVYPIISGNEAYIFFVTNEISDNKVFKKQIFNGDLNNSIEEIRKLIIESTIDKEKYNVIAIKEETKKVYDFIYKPVYDHLNNIDPVKTRYNTIVMYATGDIAIIPPGMIFDGNKYLIEKDYNLVSINGISLLNIAMNNTFPDKPIVAAAVADFNDLSNLSIIVKELKEIFGKDLIESDINNIKTLSPSVNILHIASHGKYNADNLESSMLLFSDDKPLYLRDIPALNQGINNAMVILSACETGLGKTSEGKELTSLASQFELAGARTIIASLWEVDDVSTSTIMAKFYKKLKTDRFKMPAKALKEAQLEFLNENGSGFKSSPVAWAPFIIIGDWQY
ncbi:MAG: CHAT domain-containing tetratricopeptide repeat protein [Cyanobacteriota bacterium]